MFGGVVDIPLLISCLLVGEIQSHVLKQATIGGCLERVKIGWPGAD